MLSIFKKSLKTGIITEDYPAQTVIPPGGFRGLPVRMPEKCVKCGKCAERCPTKAINTDSTEEYWSVEARRCIFCGRCEDVCQAQALVPEKRYELAEKNLAPEPVRAFGRSVHIRHLDAGSCNACDWEMVALTGPVYDIQRLGFDFVASPRHADILMVTGPVTRNLEIAARKTYAATPAPKLVVAVGTCACSGGICGKSYASSGGIDNILPVDVWIPGCPPNPRALIDGLMKAVGKL